MDPKVIAIVVVVLMLCSSSMGAFFMTSGPTGPTGPAPPPSCHMLIKRTHPSDSSLTTIDEWVSFPQTTEAACTARAGDLVGHGAISMFTSGKPPICWSKISNINAADSRYTENDVGKWIPDYHGSAYVSASACSQRQTDLTPFSGETRFQLEKP